VVLHDPLAFPRAVGRWARARGVPVAMYCHSDLALGAAGLPAGLRGPAAALLGIVQRRALAAPGAVLVASEASRARVERHTRAPVLTSRLGVDLDVFRAARPDPALRAALAARATPLLLYAGRLSSEKRIDLLVPALALVSRPAVLAVAGTGAAGPRLLRAARRSGLGDWVRLLGYVASRERLATLMATADCFIHPNPAEPFGLAPLEALAAGCRVVAPDAAGTAETLGGRGAVLVAPDDPAALAAGIDRALRGPRPRPALDDLTWELTFEREWEVYRRLAEAA
jgi:alpha-1,6-mannosyltransferase